MISFIVEGEPKGKARPKAQNLGKYIHIYTPQKSLDYENYIRWSYSSQVKEPPYMMGEYLRATIRIYQAIPKSTSKKKAQAMRDGLERPTKKPDIDNILKSIFDSLNNLAYKDDTQIIEVLATKYYSDTPRLEIELMEV